VSTPLNADIPRREQKEREENKVDIHKKVRRVLIPNIPSVTESYTQIKSNIDAKKGEDQNIPANLEPKENDL
jgi:hypothetical protein